MVEIKHVLTEKYESQYGDEPMKFFHNYWHFCITVVSRFSCESQSHWFFNWMFLYNLRAFDRDLNERVEPFVFGEKWVEALRIFNTNCGFCHSSNVGITERYVPAEKLGSEKNSIKKLKQKLTYLQLKEKFLTDLKTPTSLGFLGNSSVFQS